MQTNSYNAIVSKNETEALKEMIFNRVRQRAEALTNNVQNQYTSFARDDVMEIARNSFNNSLNPFNSKGEENNNVQKINPEKSAEIGFKQKASNEHIKEIIKLKTNTSGETISQNEIQDVMNKVGADFRTNQQFTGALNFLNTQAGISMANKHKASFEIIA